MPYTQQHIGRAGVNMSNFFGGTGTTSGGNLLALLRDGSLEPATRRSDAERRDAMRAIAAALFLIIGGVAAAVGCYAG
eukprot:gene7289-40749_t